MSDLQIPITTPGADESISSLDTILKKLNQINAMASSAQGNINRMNVRGGGGGYGPGYVPAGGPGTGTSAASAAAIGAAVGAMGQAQHTIKRSATLQEIKAVTFNDVKESGGLLRNLISTNRDYSTESPAARFMQKHFTQDTIRRLKLDSIQSGRSMMGGYQNTALSAAMQSIQDHRNRLAMRAIQEETKGLNFREGLGGLAANKYVRSIPKILSKFGGAELATMSRSILKNAVNPLTIGLAAGYTAYEMPGEIQRSASKLMPYDQAMSMRRMGEQRAASMGKSVTTTAWQDRSIWGGPSRDKTTLDIPTTLQWRSDKEFYQRRNNVVTEGLLMSKYFKDSADLKSTLIHADVLGTEDAGNKFIHYQASLRATNRVYVAPSNKKVLARTVAGG